MGKDGVVQTTLRNGLQVRLKEIRTSPLVSCWMWYRVGSRNEKPGKTGISHWVEHMQFNGTPKYPSGVLDRAINRIGATWGAGTWMDWTFYNETMPSDRIELALDLESDRMVNCTYDTPVVETERTVIISERQGKENEPVVRLAEEVRAAAFRVHSYHHDVIGDLVDLKTISRDDLHAHYRRYYTPRNAVLAIAGDFHATALIKLVRKYFGGVPGREKHKFIPRMEPQQLGEKRVIVEGPGEAPFVAVTFHTPPGDHPDFLPLVTLDSLLSGASSLNYHGGGISNKTSRLYRELVEGELAAAVSGSLPLTIDPYIYTISAAVRTDREAESVVEVIIQEIDKLLQEKVNVDEVNKAIKQSRAIFAYGSESISNQAFWLGRADMFASYKWFETYLDQIAEVTPESIIEVAQKYLVPQNRTVGIYCPVGHEISR